MKESNQPDNEDNCSRTYSFRYDDLFERQNRSLQLLSATVNGDIGELLTEFIVMLCAYESVEDYQEYQEQFNKLVGETVTKEKVQRWLLGAFIWKIQRCITINFESGSEADATTGEFAPELTRPVRPEKPGRIYKEPIEKLTQELILIAGRKPPALIAEVTRRRQIAYDAIAMITPFHLSAMLIEILSNGFIATISHPAIPKLVEMVDRAFLSSLKKSLLHTRRQGGSSSRYDFNELNEFYATGKQLFSKAKRTLKTLEDHTHEEKQDLLRRAYPQIQADLIDRMLKGERYLSTISHLAVEWAGRRCGLPANRPETEYPPTYLLQRLSSKRKKEV